MPIILQHMSLDTVLRHRREREELNTQPRRCVVVLFTKSPCSHHHIDMSMHPSIFPSIYCTSYGTQGHVVPGAYPRAPVAQGEGHWHKCTQTVRDAKQPTDAHRCERAYYIFLDGAGNPGAQRKPHSTGRTCKPHRQGWTPTLVVQANCANHSCSMSPTIQKCTNLIMECNYESILDYTWHIFQFNPPMLCR